jgi:hypothetical protein
MTLAEIEGVDEPPIVLFGAVGDATVDGSTVGNVAMFAVVAVDDASVEVNDADVVVDEHPRMHAHLVVGFVEQSC